MLCRGMARPIRIEYPGAWYHITCRGNEQRSIFADDHDREGFLKILAETVDLYEVELHCYVLMSNHFHLVVKTRQANLQKFMQRFNTSYTVYFNRKHRRSGHVYQGRYKAILIQADEYLLEISRYVHLNPVRIKKYSKLRIEDKLAIIKKYSWSSYAGYINVSNRGAFVNYEMVLQMLSGSDDRKSRKAYAQFVLDGIARDMKKRFWEKVRGQAIIGTQGFIDTIYEKYVKHKRIDEREQPWAKQLRGKPMTTQEIAEKVAEMFSIADTKELYQKRSPHRKARAVLLELCRRHLAKHMSLAQIGKQLGNISGAALVLNGRRLETDLQNNKKLKKQIERLVKGIYCK